MRRWCMLAAVVAVLATACTSGSSAEPTTIPPPPSTEPPLRPLDWAEQHLVGIRSEGAFLDDFAAGAGTGLVIDESGLILAPATAVVGADRVNVDIAGVEFPVEATIEAVAECSNLALLSVDHSFGDAALQATGSTPAFAAWVAERNWQIADATQAATVPGAVLVDVDGVVVSMDLMRTAPTEAAAVVDLAAAMRRREVTSQLGFAVAAGDDGAAVVTSVADGGVLDLQPGDAITRLDGIALVGGVDQLCATPLPDGMDVEVVRNGSRFEGVVAVETLHPASWRTREELVEAVVRIDIDVDGDGDRDGNGSGFFVSSDGYVVTNNHVVTGSTMVGVTWDGGQRTEQGTVVGRSSCSDLAVIDVDGSGYEFLEWSQQPIVLEQPVRAIGFPVGTDQITIQSGAVSKDTVDPFINSPTLPQFEHSAQIIGGNSGGPVVNENGEVVGVTNAGRDLGAAQEGFALVGQAAAPIVDQLLRGDVDHIGAELDPIAWGPGVGWYVVGVDTSSVAGSADLRRGDIIERIGELDFQSDDFTLESICATVLATSDPIPIEIVRGFAEERWDGELNGRPIQRIPDPFFVGSPDGVVGTFLPGRWVGYEPIVPESGNDFRGFRAGLEGFDWSNQFGREEYMRVLASLELAAERTTEEQLATETYDGICLSRDVTPSVVGALVGHEQRWSDCVHGVDIVSFAWLDTSQSPSPMVLLLIIDDPVDLAETVGLALSTIDVSRFPPPPVAEDDESSS